MNSLERVRATLAREETDRAPRLLYGEAIGYVPTIRDLLLSRCSPKSPREYFSMDITGVDPSSTSLSRDRFARWHGDDFHTATEQGEIDEWGVDILNPLRPECLDPAAVKRKFGDRLSFWGAVSVQRTMSTGSPDEVRAEVHERLRTVGRGGGYILAPAHVLGPETPWENIQAFFDAADEFREP